MAIAIHKGKQMPKLKVYTYTAPAHWACYFINDDPSGLEDFEIRQADRWIASINLGAPVAVEDVGFMQWPDARMSGHYNLASDCAEYTFLK